MRLIGRVLCLLWAPTALAQNYGNEWIRFDSPYWHFEVWREGIHTIDSAALANAGFPVGQVDPRDIQVFAREKELPILVEGENDGVFNAADRIVLHARPNDGWKDRFVYTDADFQNQPGYSLFNDTLRYYITWSTTSQPLRINVFANTDVTGLSPRPWAWCQSDSLFTSTYQNGQREYSLASVSDPLYVEGEGWFDTPFGGDGTNPAALLRERTIRTPRPYLLPDAPPAVLTTTLAGTTAPGGASGVDHHLLLRYGATLDLATDTIFQGYSLVRINTEIPAAAVLPTGTLVRYELVHDLNGPGQVGQTTPLYQDQVAVANVGIRYARTFDMAGLGAQRLDLPDAPADADSYLELTNVSGIPELYVLGPSPLRITMVQEGTTWKARVPANPLGDVQELYFHRTDLIRQVTAINKANNGTGYFTQFDLLTPDSACIVITNRGLWDAAQQYATYRSMSPRAARATVVVDVDELYDQYGGGVQKHPFAIRRFCAQVLDAWPTAPASLFLIGKSVKDVRLSGQDLGSRKDAIAYQRNLVPTYGNPPSDVGFTYGITGSSSEIAFPVGRLSAQDQQQVLDYLTKVQVHEAQAPAPWMKRILHFAGGFGPEELELHKSYLDGFKTVAEDTCFGGSVTTFVKSSSDVIQEVVADSLEALIDDGVTLMTFFAHASGGGFDVNIDEPGNYQWNGHHPLVIGNSCYAGNIHRHLYSSASETFVLLPEKGAIGFLSSVDVGITNNVRQYSQAFYESFSKHNYSKPLGEHQRYVVAQQLGNSQSLLVRNHALTFALHGDPNVILNSWPLPDYSIAAEDVSFSPAVVSNALDTFQVVARLRNNGKAVSGSVQVTMVRTLANGQQDFDNVATVGNLYNTREVVFDLPVDALEGGQGPNTFQVKVDLEPDEVEELEDLANNSATADLFITTEELLPTWPYAYAVVPGPTPVLFASTGDPFAAPANYVFQIDTTDTFSSPALEGAIVNAPGGVVSWQPETIYALVQPQDSVVFFWRCSPDTAAALGPLWRERSFQIIGGQFGWAQAHYYQFEDDRFDLITYDRPERDFDFYTGSRQINCFNKGKPVGDETNIPRYMIDLAVIENNGCGSLPAFIVAVIDPLTFEPWQTAFGGANPQNDFGNLNQNGACRQRVERYFIFRFNVPTEMDGMYNMLSTVPDGHYVLVWTWQYLNRYTGATNQPQLFDLMATMGADSLQNMQDSVPYIFFARKGDATSGLEAIGDTITDYITLSVDVPAPGDRGQIRAPLAGPATDWNALYWQAEVEDGTTDSTRLRLYGLPSANGNPQLVLDEPFAAGQRTDLDQVLDAEAYPYARLEIFLSDSTLDVPTPAQLQRWHLMHGPAPECAIDPPSGFASIADSLFEGQEAQVVVPVRNVSDIDMDSLLITAWVVDANNHRRTVRYARTKPLAAGATLLDTIRFPVLGLGGGNTLLVEANPVDTATGAYDQLEQYHFNNFLQLRFMVLTDRTNPLLDVTFDGVHILDGDIVSAQPVIEVELDDENTALLMNDPADTTLFKVFLTPPGAPLQRIYFRDGGGQELMQFIPANGPQNKCRIIYRPTFAVDGIYTLAVRGSDVSENESGDNDLRIRFEVINRPTITEVLNYPNPFTTSTRFVFTVTGTTPPSYVKVQIMTVTGRVVREISSAELGPLRVGRNMTEFAWDGTDSFGDRLGRGVYMYRVDARLNGAPMEVRSTAASSYFKNGVGTMYLLR
jgi:Peptidase family C25